MAPAFPPPPQWGLVGSHQGRKLNTGEAPTSQQRKMEEPREALSSSIPNLPGPYIPSSSCPWHCHPALPPCHRSTSQPFSAKRAVAIPKNPDLCLKNKKLKPSAPFS